MIRQLRRKLASSISLIETEEDFLYSNWLRIPETKVVSLGKVISKLLDTSFISFYIKPPFSIAHFFQLGDTKLYPENLSYLFGKIGTNPVFFQLLYVPSRVITHSDFNPAPPEDSYRKIDFRIMEPLGQEIDIQFNLKKPNSFVFRIAEPKIEDHLNNLKPRVIKIDLLNENDFKNNDENTLVKDYEIQNFGSQKIKSIDVESLPGKPKIYKVKVPGMGKYKSKIYTLKLPAPTLPKISKHKTLKGIEFSGTTAEIKLGFEEIKTFSEQINFDHDTSLQSTENLITEDGAGNYIIKKLLERTFNVEWSSRSESNIELTKNEEEIAKFLAENNRAFLAEEPGLETKKEVLSALQFLFSSRVLTKTLIVTPKFNLGFSNAEHQLGSTDGWIGKIEKYLPDMTYNIIRGIKNEKKTEWDDPSIIHITAYDTFIKEWSENAVAKKELQLYDCIIFDEVKELIGSNINLDGVNPQVLWMLSSNLSGDIPAGVNSMLDKNTKFEQYKFVRLSDGINGRFDLNLEEYWLERDEQQKVEYKETLVDCRKELKRILESGNPMHYQANIFILLHKLFQAQNFANKSAVSPKSKLLLNQVNSIKQNGRQVLVISQYDQQGIKKIERLFDDADISYVSVSTGYSPEQLRKSVSLFKTKKDVTVFLTNDKISKLNFGDYFIPYIIRFDTWWNPASVWQLGSLFDLDAKNIFRNTLNIFSYKMLDTMDEQIRTTLLAKNLKDRNIIKAIPANTFNEILSVNDWVKMFGLPVEDEEVKYNQLFNATIERMMNFSSADLKESLSRFFMRLGYNNIEINENQNEKFFDMTGEGIYGGKPVYLLCKYFSDQDVNKNKIEQLLVKMNGRQQQTTFVISNQKFADDCYEIENKNLVMLDLEKLATYYIAVNFINLPVEQPA